MEKISAITIVIESRNKLEKFHTVIYKDPSPDKTLHEWPGPVKIMNTYVSHIYDEEFIATMEPIALHVPQITSPVIRLYPEISKFKSHPEILKGAIGKGSTGNQESDYEKPQESVLKMKALTSRLVKPRNILSTHLHHHEDIFTSKKKARIKKFNLINIHKVYS